VICQRCGKNRAVLHTYCISNNQLIDVHYCEECGKIQNCGENGYIDDSMQNLLEGLLQSARNENYSIPDKKCEICGTSAREILKSRFLGCPNCYEIFSDVIDIHDNGEKKLYRRSEFIDDNSEQLLVLRKRLMEAVQLEDFESAAQLRDRISGIEKDGFLGDN